MVWSVAPVCRCRAYLGPNSMPIPKSNRRANGICMRRSDMQRGRDAESQKPDRSIFVNDHRNRERPVDCFSC